MRAWGWMVLGLSALLVAAWLLRWDVRQVGQTTFKTDRWSGTVYECASDVGCSAF